MENKLYNKTFEMLFIQFLLVKNQKTF